MDIDSAKNNIYNQEIITSSEKTLMIKIYNYFYQMIRTKKEYNSFVLYILLILETLQGISYAFSEPHLQTWKMNDSAIKVISKIISAPRISTLFNNLKTYSIVFFVIIIIFFLFSLFFCMQILFGDPDTNFYQEANSIISLLINPITIFLFTPIIELMLMPINCDENNRIKGISKNPFCWTSVHYLYVILGILCSLLLIIISIFMLSFYFFPFQNYTTTIRLTPSNDIIILLCKIIFIIKYFFVKNEYLSIVIMLLCTLFILLKSYSNPTYNKYKLQMIIDVKNAFTFWTFCALLFAKLFENAKIEGYIFFLLFGYPIAGYFAVIIFKEKEFDFNYICSDFKSINEFLEKTKYNAKLINSFLEYNKSIRIGNELENKRNIVILNGNIRMHINICLNNDCPLRKFLENEGNFNLQKQCLLNYMTYYFNLGIKQYPLNSMLLIFMIQFNQSKRYNLNNAKSNLAKLKKINCSFDEKFLVYCIDQEIKENKNQNSNNDFDKDFDNSNSEVDNIFQKYQRLKFLIENCTKVYSEFWGIFATHITNNLNINKLYSLGEKLNKYLYEINYLWDNELKNKKISSDCQTILLLFSTFLREILWQKKKSEEVSKKLNNENFYQYHQSNKKIESKDLFQSNNLDYLLENQDYLIFASSDEKGNSKIINCSNSITFLLGYQKNDLINKSIDILMPNIFIDGHNKMLADRIKKIHTRQINLKENYINADNNNKQSYILAKSKMGYIIPLNSTFTIYDDNDYSNTYIIKAKMDNKDLKSVYAYYVLTKPDFIVDNISSSAINLGLSMDLLKKHMIKMNILIRGEKNNELNLYKDYRNYDEEPKIITWIFPDLIYPKDDNIHHKEDQIPTLLEKSFKKKYNLQINTLSYDNNEILGFIFKFTEIVPKAKKKFSSKDLKSYLPKNNKYSIIFDLLNLSYIRTILVDKKTGFRNLRTTEDTIDINNVNKSYNDSKKKKSPAKENNEMDIIMESFDEEETKKAEITLLSKEKIIEMQANDSTEVKKFISSLQFYGEDVTIEKFRPNKERYTVGKSAEPLVKISISHFLKRIEEKMGSEIFASKKLNKSVNNPSTEEHLIENNSYLFSGNSNNNIENKNINENLNNGISSMGSPTLSNIFQGKSIIYIKIMSLFIFIFLCLIFALDFFPSYLRLGRIQERVTHLQKSYELLINMAYIKFYVTEAVIANSLEKYICYDLINQSKINFINIIKSNLQKLRQEFTEIYSIFLNYENFGNEYQNFIQNTNMTIKILGSSELKDKNFFSSLERISTSVFYISTADQNVNITLNDKNTYELMYNLLNDYYINWESVIKILKKETSNHSKVLLTSLIFVICTIIFYIIFLCIFWNLLIIFSKDREKPINLFLTIKKTIFENLKNASESFSNKLLNKFFGNEVNEEESELENNSNIHDNDINIIKFKASNERSSSLAKMKSYLNAYIYVIIFFLIAEIYIIFKYLFYSSNINSIKQFIDVFHSTYYTHINLVFSLDVVKSFFLNENITILNKNSEDIFYEVFCNISNSAVDTFILNSNTECFLKNSFLPKLRQTLYGNFIDLLDDSTKVELAEISKDGFKPFLIRFFEIIRFSCLQYLSNGEDKMRKNGIVELINEYNWYEISFSIKNITKPWFKNILKLMSKSFSDFISHCQLIYLVLFISIIVILILLYCIIWKSFEEKLNALLKRSMDLINLIPEEIKLIIIEKLNE